MTVLLPSCWTPANCKNTPPKGGVFRSGFEILKLAEQGAEQAVVTGAAWVNQHGQHVADLQLFALQDFGGQLFAVRIRRAVKLNQLLLCRRQAL